MCGRELALNSIHGVARQEQESAQSKTAEDENAFLAASEGIAAEAILLVICEASYDFFTRDEATFRCTALRTGVGRGQVLELSIWSDIISTVAFGRFVKECAACAFILALVNLDELFGCA